MVFTKKAAPKKRRVSRAIAGAARSHYTSRGGVKGIVGSLKPALDGGIGQIAASIGNQFMAPWGGIAGLIGTGYLMKNDTLMTIGGMHAASQFPVAGILGGLGGNTANANTGALI